MRVSQDEKAKSRARILAAASRRMRETGLAGAGLADIMRDAGLTHGGFYRHFATRDDLLAAALQATFADFLLPLEQALQKGDPVQAVDAFRTLYLSSDHVTHPELGCPVPAVGSEMAHAPEPLRTAFDDGLSHVIDLLAPGKPGTPADQLTHALRDFAMMAGAVLLARAAGPAMAAQVLAACADPA